MNQIEDLQDKFRRDEPSALARVVRTRQEGKARLSASVSPCSWLYPDYGLQIEVVMAGGGGNATVLDKGIKFKDAMLLDIDRLFSHVRVQSCTCCGKPAFDQATVNTNRAGKCESCWMTLWQANWKSLQAKNEARRVKNDADMKAKGYKVRVDAWVHPACGDDYPIAIYLTEMSIPAVERQLRDEGSVKLDDFTFAAL